MTPIQIMVARYDKQALSTEARSLQYRIEKILLGSLILSFFATKGHIAAEYDKVDLRQIGVNLGAMANVLNQGIAHHLPIEILIFLMPI